MAMVTVFNGTRSSWNMYRRYWSLAALQNCFVIVHVMHVAMAYAYTAAFSSAFIVLTRVASAQNA
jgi:hypothetical protein